MKRYWKNICRIAYLTVLAGIITACDNSDPSKSPYVTPPEEPAESTVLIYAVATNTLSSNLTMDKNEMIAAAENIDLETNNVLLFQNVYDVDLEWATTYGHMSLLKLAKTEEGYEWETVKEYPEESNALDPRLMGEVIDYATTFFPAETYGLILWSHSSGSQPYLSATKSTEAAAENSNIQLPSVSWFGQDLTSTDEKYRYMNIDTLEEVLPDNFFHFIWFDSCYMGNVESAYQLRNKSDYYIGYATEVWEYGMPYDTVLPKLMGRNPDIASAADSFFKYYSENPYYSLQNATIAVLESPKIENLASFCSPYFQEGLKPESMTNFIKYTRGSTGPFYDLGDYVKAMASLEEMEFSDEEWKQLLDDCMLYYAATPRDFSGNKIDAERFSGLSTHVYQFYQDDAEEPATESYYKSLEWYKAVFQ